MVTYPFAVFSLPDYPGLQYHDCPNGICTFVLSWLSDASFGVLHEIKQRRADHCDDAIPTACVFGPWIDLPDTSGFSRVITFTPNYNQKDSFEFQIRACAPFRGCSAWSAPASSVDQTLYGASFTAAPATASWICGNVTGLPLAQSITVIPTALRPTITINHNYPFHLYSTGVGLEAPLLQGTTIARIAYLPSMQSSSPNFIAPIIYLSDHQYPIITSFFNLGTSTLQLEIYSQTNAQNQIVCGYTIH